MKLRGISLAIVTVLLLAGCTVPPIREGEFERRMTSLDGVASAYIGRQENLPFIYEYHAHVGVDSDITSEQLRAAFSELAALPAFSRYSMGEGNEHLLGVRWSSSDIPVERELDFVVSIWPVAAALPEGTTVDFSNLRDVTDVRVRQSPDEPSDPEVNAVIAAQFAAHIAHAESLSELKVDIHSVGFDGVPGRCPGLVEAVDVLVESTELASLDVVCGNTNRVAASVGDDPQAILTELEEPLHALGFDLVVTPDWFRASADLPADLFADFAAVVEASQQVPGAPAARATSEGIEFQTADEQTVRALVAAVESMPEYERIGFTVHMKLPETDFVLPFSKRPRQDLYLDPFIAMGKHPSFMSLRADSPFGDPVAPSLHFNAANIDDAVSILHSAGFRDAAGLIMGVNVYVNDRAILNMYIVIHDDGSVTPRNQVDDNAERKFLEVWNAA